MSGAKLYYWRSTISLWLRSELAEMHFGILFSFIEALLERAFNKKLVWAPEDVLFYRSESCCN